jgi:membrane protein DedA with SNARE-associated domain
MPDLQPFLEQWRYAAIFLAVILGNMGLPVPEETALALAGYLAARGVMRLPAALATGVISAVIGDNLGYWVGRRYGRVAIERYERGLFVSPERLPRVADIMARYGALAVFVARFVAGLRFLAGPLAGAMGMPPLRFTLANALGAVLYVPYATGIGYAVGYGAGDLIQRLVGRAEPVAIVGIVVLTLAFVARRLLRRAGAGAPSAAAGPS